MKTEEFRQKIANVFIASLEEDPRRWKKNWQAGVTGWPENAATGKKYKGINLLYLKVREQENGYADNRWCTYKQIQDEGWKLKRGSKGEKVEYWMPYDPDQKKVISWKEYRAAENRDEMPIYPRYYTVFNASQIEGIPALMIRENDNDVNGDELIEKISGNMGIEILEDGGDRAFYRPAEDKIHLPEKRHFDDEYSYVSTALHELAHATGHETRLARDMAADYAYEELVAEIASCFMSEHAHADMSEAHFENHKAYIQGWAKDIRDQPEILIRAIKEASQAANFLEYSGELISQAEYEKSGLKAPELKADRQQDRDYNVQDFTKLLLKHLEHGGYTMEAYGDILYAVDINGWMPYREETSLKEARDTACSWIEDDMKKNEESLKRKGGFEELEDELQLLREYDIDAAGEAVCEALRKKTDAYMQKNPYFRQERLAEQQASDRSPDVKLQAERTMEI